MMERFDETSEHNTIHRRDTVALTTDGRSATYRQLLEDASTVAIYSEMSMHAVAAAFGIPKAGCVLACIRNTIRTAELKPRINTCVEPVCQVQCRLI